MSPITQFCSVKFLPWKSCSVKCWTNIMSALCTTREITGLSISTTWEVLSTNGHNFGTTLWWIWGQGQLSEHLGFIWWQLWDYSWHYLGTTCRLLGYSLGRTRGLLKDNLGTSRGPHFWTIGGHVVTVDRSHLYPIKSTILQRFSIIWTSVSSAAIHNQLSQCLGLLCLAKFQ